MDLQLGGRSVAVVGAARGLGRAIAEAFAAEGARVALLDVSTEVHAAAQAMASTGATVISRVVDVTNPAAVAATADDLGLWLGPVEHLVFAVGIGSGGFGFPFWEVPVATWEPVLRVNLIGAAHVAQAFGPRMAAVGRGTMLFLSSIAGQIGSQTDPPYSASKAGLINFAQCVAKDLAPSGVRVNTICPGMVRTALNRSVWQAWANRQPAEQRQSYEEWAGEKIRRLVPLNRWQTPDDIAALGVFLASDKARNITGQTINVDGGFVMHW